MKKKSQTRPVAELIREFLGKYGKNLFSCGFDLKVGILGRKTTVESIWMKGNEPYMHFTHHLAEGDIMVSSLPDKEQERLASEIDEFMSTHEPAKREATVLW